MTTHPPEASQSRPAITVRDVVAVLFRRKWILIGVFAVTTAVTAAFTLSQPVFWEATGKVLVRRGVQDNLMQSYYRTLSWEEELASEVETAMSPAIVQRAATLLRERRQKSGLETYAIDPTRVDAAVVGESNVIAISYRDLVPEVCTEVTNVLLAAYTHFREETYRLPFPEEFFEDEIAKAKAELDALQQEKRDFLSQNDIVDIGNERINMLGARSQARGGANQLRQEMSELETRLAQMHDYLKDPTAYPDIPFTADQMVGNENVISGLKRDLVQRRIRYDELSKVYQPGMPELVRVEREIEGLEKLLADEVRDHIRLAELELASHRAKLEQAESEVSGISTRLEALPQQESRLADLDRRITALSTKYEDLIRDKSHAKVTQATTSKQTVFVLAPASAPYPKNTKDYVRIALAPIFSLIVGLGLAFFVDSLDTTVKSPRDAETTFDLPVLATLNEQKHKRV